MQHNNQVQIRELIPIDKQQLIDTTILKSVCSLMQFKGNNLEAIQYFCQNRELIRRTINWFALDQNIEIYFKTKSYSYQRFTDIIVPNMLPMYPLEIQNSIQNFIEFKIQQAQNVIQNMNKVQVTNFMRELEQVVKIQFDLKFSDQYSYKKQSDKNRYTIKSIIMRLRNEEMSE
ncbi:Hypothetical_protein [Hexamita inflata]|uniref:Hypothetical_protein n=1 Tax=Hexamita inflata TaxID=28002 RepID=A0AA86TX99_9EUKA|nr:Hypothetical protein HINF_LOCUS18122 [Hexamita inflata]